MGLVAKGSAWYLVARVDGETRTYRVSRMSAADVLEETAVRPEGFDLAGYWAQSESAFREQLPKYYATFVVDPEVMRWVRYRGWRVEQETAAGERMRIRVRFDVEEEALQFALSFGAKLEVLEPAELRERVIESARAILAKHIVR